LPLEDLGRGGIGESIIERGMLQGDEHRGCTGKHEVTEAPSQRIGAIRHPRSGYDKFENFVFHRMQRSASRAS